MTVSLHLQLALNLIPVANYMFALGGAAGAALWAADIEVGISACGRSSASLV